MKLNDGCLQVILKTMADRIKFLEEESQRERDRSLSEQLSANGALSEAAGIIALYIDWDVLKREMIRRRAAAANEGDPEIRNDYLERISILKNELQNYVAELGIDHKDLDCI